MKRLDFSNRVQNIKCSTLVICGEKDKARIPLIEKYMKTSN